MSSKLEEKLKSKKVKVGNSKVKSWLALLVAVVVFVVIVAGINASAKKGNTTISVVTLNKTVNVKTKLSEDILKPLKIKNSDFQSGMIKYSDKAKVLDMYAANYIRQNTPIFEDSVTKDVPVRSKFLYELKDGEEALTFVYNSDEGGGKILLPGDIVRIRATYAEKVPGSATNETTMKTEILFDKVAVTDLLNQSGESISDIIDDMQRLTKEERYQVISSDKFREKLTPKSMVLALPSPMIDTYTKIKGFSDTKYIVTLLKRSDNLKTTDNISNNPLLDIVDTSSTASSSNTTKTSTK